MDRAIDMPDFWKQRFRTDKGALGTRWQEHTTSHARAAQHICATPNGAAARGLHLHATSAMLLRHVKRHQLDLVLDGW